MEKTIQQLNLSDDFLFAKVMADSEICRRVLEKILTVPIRKVEAPATQRTIDLLFEGKGVRLDVYVNDDEGTVYNIEMQCNKKRNLPKRTRYYAGSIDLDLIAAGEDYINLKKAYVIFICTFDPFRDGRHIYTFENRCRENLSLSLGDESIKVFLNTRGTAGRCGRGDEGISRLCGGHHRPLCRTGKESADPADSPKSNRSETEPQNGGGIYDVDAERPGKY